VLQKGYNLIPRTIGENLDPEKRNHSQGKESLDSEEQAMMGNFRRRKKSRPSDVLKVSLKAGKCGTHNNDDKTQSAQRLLF